MGHVHRIAGTLRRMVWIMLLMAAPAFAGVSLQQPLLPRPPQESGKFGGGIHDGAASLDLTAALVQAGGGPEKFSMQAALVEMLGQASADEELARLRGRYGARAVQEWLKISTWLMEQGLVQLRNVGTELPSPSDDLSGAKLAAALADAGIAPDDGTFWSGYWYDRLFSHGINKVLEEDLDRHYGERRAHSVYTVNNQAMSDISQHVHTSNSSLAKLH
jgi:hypothetical protein